MSTPTDILLAILIICALLVLCSGPSSDDTDPPGKHSGLRLYIDHRTGCHYVGTAFGGITPRLDRDGKQVCDLPGIPPE